MALPALRDDGATLMAMGALAYMVETLLHEAIGHGGACLAMGGHVLMIQSLSMQCSQDSVGMVLAGPGMNVLAAVVAGLAVRMVPDTPAATNARFFAWLVFVFNGLVAAGYLAVGGATGFGDWSVVFDGHVPEIVWRPGAVIVGVAIYLVGLRMAATLFARIVGPSGFAGWRLGGLTIIPGLGAASAALAAVLYGQAGDLLRLGLAAGSSLFVGWSLMAIDRFGVRPGDVGDRAVVRSYPTILAAVVATLGFIMIIGPGWVPGG